MSLHPMVHYHFFMERITKFRELDVLHKPELHAILQTYILCNHYATNFWPRTQPASAGPRLNIRNDVFP